MRHILNINVVRCICVAKLVSAAVYVFVRYGKYAILREPLKTPHNVRKNDPPDRYQGKTSAKKYTNRASSRRRHCCRSNSKSIRKCAQNCANSKKITKSADRRNFLTWAQIPPAWEATPDRDIPGYRGTIGAHPAHGFPSVPPILGEARKLLVPISSPARRVEF